MVLDDEESYSTNAKATSSNSNTDSISQEASLCPSPTTPPSLEYNLGPAISLRGDSIPKGDNVLEGDIIDRPRFASVDLHAIPVFPRQPSPYRFSKPLRDQVYQKDNGNDHISRDGSERLSRENLHLSKEDNKRQTQHQHQEAVEEQQERNHNRSNSENNDKDRSLQPAKRRPTLRRIWKSPPKSTQQQDQEMESIEEAEEKGNSDVDIEDVDDIYDDDQVSDNSECPLAKRRQLSLPHIYSLSERNRKVHFKQTHDGLLRSSPNPEKNCAASVPARLKRPASSISARSQKSPPHSPIRDEEPTSNSSSRFHAGSAPAVGSW